VLDRFKFVQGIHARGPIAKRGDQVKTKVSSRRGTTEKEFEL
jgi:hypothetical protein